MKPPAKIIKGSGFKVQRFRGSEVPSCAVQGSEVHDERFGE
jgi:predicted nucleic acid-binding Zn ribbon protein